jgi:5-methylcytosine-specific restriction endonuclease McrA
MGLILPQMIEVKISSKNYKHYEEKGYKIPRHLDKKGKLKLSINETMEVHALDLPRENRNYVKVLCDYCGKQYEATYEITQNILEHEYNNKCACKKCYNKKLSELQQYIRERDDGVIPLYRNKDWLYNEYIIKNKTAQEIADECNINIRNIFTYLSDFNIEKLIDIHEKLDYNTLYKEYIVNKLTTREICKDYHCKESSIIELLNEYKIKRRTSRESIDVYYNYKGGRELKTKQSLEVWKRDGFKEKMCKINKYHANKISHRINLSASLQGVALSEWKGFLTRKNNRIRNNIEYKEWRENVFKRDNYTCQCCGRKNGNGDNVYLNAHHKESFADNEDLRLDVNNGITLCQECHNPKFKGSFHNLYGTLHNTNEQLNKYIKMKQSEVA